MAIRNALIAVDFDGTVVTHAYPEIGDDAGAVPVLKELTDNGCRLILYTMRHGKLLDDAIRWFRERGIPLYAVNENPSQQRWTSSPKVHADLYIDDSSLGCPIRFVDGVKRPVADWNIHILVSFYNSHNFIGQKYPFYSILQDFPLKIFIKYRNILRNRNIYIFFTSQTTIESLKSLLKSVITFIIYLIYNSINTSTKQGL